MGTAALFRKAALQVLQALLALQVLQSLQAPQGQLHNLHHKVSSTSSTSCSCFAMSRALVSNLPLFLKHALLLHIFCSSVKCALVNVQFTDAAPGEKLPADLLTNTDQWTSKAALTDTAVEAMECAVRCTQLNTGCKSFLTTNHTCYLGKDAPATDSFVEAAGQSVTYYLKA